MLFHNHEWLYITPYAIEYEGVIRICGKCQKEEINLFNEQSRLYEWRKNK